MHAGIISVFIAVTWKEKKLCQLQNWKKVHVHRRCTFNLGLTKGNYEENVTCAHYDADHATPVLVALKMRIILAAEDVVMTLVKADPNKAAVFSLDCTKYRVVMTDMFK